MTEPFLPLPTPRAQLPVATSFRSTWLASSLRGLRQRNLIDAYFRELPAELHEVVRGSIVGEWLPIGVALAHYAACDALELAPSDILAMGKDATTYAHATIFGVIVRSARAAGATPWTIFGIQRRLWERVWVGGGVGITKTGPKDALVEIVGWPCARYRYVRIGMRGVITGQCELVCQRAFASEITRLSTPTSLTYKVSWV